MGVEKALWANGRGRSTGSRHTDPRGCLQGWRRQGTGYQALRFAIHPEGTESRVARFALRGGFFKRDDSGGVLTRSSGSTAPVLS
jgi:hypothetical protein